MKKPIKILYAILSGILVLLILAAIAINLFADKALKMAIESAGSKALNVGVSVSDVDLSILGGKLGLQNLVINNPAGYQHERLLELSEGKITIETGSLLSDVVNIKEIRLDRVNVVLEQRGISGNNLQDVIKELPAKDKKTSEPGGKKLHIDSLEITNAKASVKLLPIPGKVDTVTLKLAPIRMTDLGGENDIDTIALARKVLLAIAGGIVEQGTDVLPKEMVGTLVSQLTKLEALPAALLDKGGKVLDVGTGIGKEAVEVGKEVGGEIKKGAEGVHKGITDGLKGLLKKKETE